MAAASIKRVGRIARTCLVGALVVFALGIVAFGPRANRETPRDVVVVDYWEKWNGSEGQAMQDVVDLFNTTVGKERGIYVRLLSTSAIEQKTLVATAAGVPPDIAGLFSQNMAQYAALDALEPLDDLANEFGITEKIYKKVFWDQCRYDNKLYALVSSALNVGLYYNAKTFNDRADDLRKAGLDPTRAPRTLEELDQYAVALDQRDAKGRITVTGYLPYEPGWYLNYNCLWFGGRWWDETNKRFTFTSPEMIRTFEWVQSYIKRLGPDAVSEFRSGVGNFDSPQNAFLAGTVVMEQQGSFLANFIRNQKPDMAGQWAVAPFPSASGVPSDITYCNADIFVIPRGAKHKREAFEFLAFAHRQDVAEKFAQAHCKLTQLASVSEAFFNGHPNPYIRLFDRLAANPNAHGTDGVPIYAEVDSELQVFFQKLALNQVTPQQGLAELQTSLQAKYDDFMAQQRKRKGT